MNQIRHIRKTVFNLSQVEFGELVKVAQGTVSKWENGELEPSRSDLELIRLTAKERGFPWEDSWFFEVPSPSEAVPCSEG